MLQRRKFLLGLGLAPAIIKTPNLLMPIKTIEIISRGRIWSEYQIQQINKFLDLDNSEEFKVFFKDLNEEFEKDEYDICR